MKVKIPKSEVVAVMKQLREKGYKLEELAVALERSNQTLWAWSSEATNRIPSKSDYEVLKRMTVD